MEPAVQSIAERVIDSSSDFVLGFATCLILGILLVREFINYRKWCNEKKGNGKTLPGNSEERFIKLLDDVSAIHRQSEKISDIEGRLHSFHNDINHSLSDFSKTLDKTRESADNTLDGVTFLVRKAKEKDQFI